jgi:hypothetical protein
MREILPESVTEVKAGPLRRTPRRPGYGSLKTTVTGFQTLTATPSLVAGRYFHLRA